MPIVELNVLEWRDLRACQKEARADCHAAFTVNQDGEIWPFASYGNTPIDWQFDIRGWIKPLDRIAEEFTRARCGPGRFLISHDRWAYWKENERGREKWFVQIVPNEVFFASKTR